MKLIIDPHTHTNHVILENFQPNIADTKLLTQFAADAFNVPEVIGGIYFNDCHGQQHQIELKNQSLQTFLLAVHSLGARVPLHIDYDDHSAPVDLWSKFWRVPKILIKILQFFGFCADSSYKSYFEYVRRYPRKNIIRESGANFLK